MINYMISSVKKYIQENINTYAYDNSSIDITRVEVGSPQSDITATDDTFIVVDDYGMPLVSNDENYLLNNTVVYNSGTSIKRKITGYNNTTGEIVLDEPLGVELATSDTFSIEIFNSMFIYEGDAYTNRDRLHNQEEVVPIFVRVTTKNDGQRKSLHNLVESFMDLYYGNNLLIPIYDDDGNYIIDAKGTSISVTPIDRSGESLQASNLYFDLKYYKNYN